MKKIKLLFLGAGLSVTLILPVGSRAQYTVKAVSNGGTVTGTIKYLGVAGKPEVLEITRDKEACKCGHSGPLYSEELIVNQKNKGIQNVVVSITNISQGKDWTVPEGGFVVEQRGCFFSRHVLVAPAGKVFHVLNNDGILHNVHTHSKINRPVTADQQTV